MSTRSPILLASSNNFMHSFYLYHEGTDGKFRLEIKQDIQNGESSFNIEISKELKDIIVNEFQIKGIIPL